MLLKTGTSSKRLLQAFTAHASSRLPKNRFDPLYSYYNCDFDGDSFMLNPHELITYAFKWTPKEVAQYIGLASYRNYSDYLVTSDKSLDLFHSPVDQDTINNNRLLRIVEDRVYFYYEEDMKRRNIIWH
ncbi:MAG: hypothetical protein EOO61_06865 [Hymenobacter sp.]|nr:MAG: hypothetical protein EOO61_06865 [Hymenobacter sp.]